MNKLTKIIAGTATLGAIGLWPIGADAHHPEISVNSICVEPDSSLVSVFAQAWAIWPENGQPVDDSRRYNPNVQVSISNKNVQDGWVAIGSGQFTPENDYYFVVNTIQLNAVGTVTVRVTSMAPWGINGEYPGVGDVREATIDLSDDCYGTTTTVPVMNPPGIITTTTASDSRVIVRGPNPAAPIEKAPNFPG